MTFTKEQKKAAYRNLPPEVREMIMNPEITDIISSNLKKMGLLALQEDQADSEILYAMYGLQSFSEALKNISKITNKNLNDLDMLKNVLEENIFKKIGKQIIIQDNVLGIDKKSQIMIWGGKFPVLNVAFDKVTKIEIAKKIKNSISTHDTNNFPQQLKTLPQPVIDLIIDGVWQERVEEIARKYSLDPTQIDTLTSNVLFILISLDEPEVFLKLMTSELGISRLLADQIIEDLEMRVFEYAVKTVENKEKKTPVSGNINSQNKPDIKKESVVEKPKVPEIKPINLPMVEKGEVAHNVPSLKPESTVTKPVFVEKTNSVIPEQKTSSHITYTSNKNNEVVQKPVSVPRFTGVKIEETTEKFNEPSTKVAEPIQKSVPLDIISEKPEVKKEVKPQEITPSKSSVDPYREPIE